MNKSKRFKTKLYGVTDANQSEQRGRQEQSTGAIEKQKAKPSTKAAQQASQHGWEHQTNCNSEQLKTY